MDSLPGILRDWIAIAGALVAAVFWFATLEGRARRNGREARDNRDAIGRETQDRIEALRTLERRLEKQREEDRASRERDWQHMNARLDGIQTDIKELLQRTVPR